MTSASIRSNNNTRTTALTYQNGVLVKSGATTRRYLGTIRIGGTAGQTEDSEARRYVWNANNRKDRKLFKADSNNFWTDTSTPNGDVWKALNQNATNRICVISGYTEDSIDAQSALCYDNNGNNANGYALAGIGANNPAGNNAGSDGIQYLTQISGTTDTGPAYAALQQTILGMHFYHATQCVYSSASSGTGTVRIYSRVDSSGNPIRQSGILAQFAM